MENKVTKMVEFIKANVNMEEVYYTFGEMCINRTPLHYQNHSLYNQIDDLIEEFCMDNDMNCEDIDIEEIFDKIMD